MQVACVPGLDGGSTQEFAAEVRTVPHMQTSSVTKKRVTEQKSQKARLMSGIRRAFAHVGLGRGFLAV
jgi:hypothetical protein